MPARVPVLVVNQSETGAAITEGGHENWQIFLERRKDDRFAVLCVLVQIATHFANEFARRIRPWFKRIGDLSAGCIANPELIFVDVGVVNTIDGQPAQG